MLERIIQVVFMLVGFSVGAAAFFLGDYETAAGGLWLYGGFVGGAIGFGIALASAQVMRKPPKN